GSRPSTRRRSSDSGIRATPSAAASPRAASEAPCASAQSTKGVSRRAEPPARGYRLLDRVVARTRRGRVQRPQSERLLAGFELGHRAVSLGITRTAIEDAGTAVAARQRAAFLFLIAD